MKKGNVIRTVIFYVVLAAIVVALASWLFGGRAKKQKEIENLSDVIAYFENGQVKEFDVDDDTLYMTVYETETVEGVTSVKKNDKGEPITNDCVYAIGNQTVFYEATRDYWRTDNVAGEKTVCNWEAPKGTPWYLYYLPYAIFLVVMIVAMVLITRKMSNGMGGINNFGKARVKDAGDNKSKVTFADVAGADEEKAELEEVVEFLKDPTAFSKLGAKIPHGVLLVGPPGNGKTLLAKAVAGEAGVPFYAISGSDFVEVYVGVGASRVRDLFDTARKSPAAIVFIDEIDAVGRQRGAGLGGGHDEREQTLNQLLVEMDGFGSHEGIIVIAATNRPDILDQALLRPGRFDRQITVRYPDIKGREAILKVHSKGKPFEETVDLARVAEMTAGFTGADLANLLNESALVATRRKKSLIGMEDIEDAYIRVIAGPKKKSRAMKETEKRNTAYHEAGHAILAYCLPTQDPVRQISIIPSGRALGYTLNPPKEDKYSVYKKGLKEEISMLLGGRAAEEIVFGDISGGASNDIERATKIAKEMVTRLGMSDELGPRCFGSGQSEVFLGRDFSSTPDYSDEIAAKIDSEIHNIIIESYQKAKAILNEHRQKLDFVAEFLVKNEIMDGEQFAAAMERDEVTFEELEEMTEAKRRKSREENDERRRAEEIEARKKAEEEAEARAKAAEEKGNGEKPDFKDDTL